MENFPPINTVRRLTRIKFEIIYKIFQKTLDKIFKRYYFDSRKLKNEFTKPKHYMPVRPAEEFIMKANTHGWMHNSLQAARSNDAILGHGRIDFNVHNTHLAQVRFIGEWQTGKEAQMVADGNAHVSATIDDQSAQWLVDQLAAEIGHQVDKDAVYFEVGFIGCNDGFCPRVEASIEHDGDCYTIAVCDVFDPSTVEVAVGA